MIPDSQGILTIDNVPEGVRVWPKLKLYRAPANGKYRIPDSERKPRANGEAIPVYVFDGVMITGYRSRDLAARELDLHIGPRISDRIEKDGFYAYPKSGLILWYKSGTIPDCVPRPWVFAASENKGGV